MKFKHAIILLVLWSCGSNKTENPFGEKSKTPAILGFDNISTKEFHESINYLSLDNTTVFFTRSDKDFKTATLYSSNFSMGKWSSPEVLPFSGTYYDAGIQFSPSEDKIFFTSKRNPSNPELSPEWNIWQVVLDQNNKWGQPEAFPPPLNSEGQECCLTMNKSGLAYFASNRAGSWDIYEAVFSDNQFIKVKKLNTNVNSEKGEWPSYLNDKGDLLLISSIRDTGYGGDDIYLVRKEEGEWKSPVLLDSTVNSTSYEDSPLISQDGKYLLFSSWKKNELTNGVSNIYYLALPIPLK